MRFIMTCAIEAETIMAKHLRITKMSILKCWMMIDLQRSQKMED